VDESKQYRGAQVVRVEHDDDRDGKFEKIDDGERQARSLGDRGQVRSPRSCTTRRAVAWCVASATPTGTAAGHRRGADPATGIVLREDRDLNGDGRPDVSAYYENGQVVRREISGEYLRAQKAPSAAAPGVNVETRDFRKLPGT
jgi:hypothetical protein